MKKVFITGASKGIGKAIALKLQHEYSLVLHASTEASLKELVSQIDDMTRHHVLCADLSDSAALKELCSTLKKNHSNELFAVINNAGITLDKSIIFQPEADIDKIMQVNLKAPILISKTAFKIFHAQKKGVILNIGSCVGETGNAFQSVYAATKAGIVAFSKSLAREAGALLDEHNIRVLTLSPGYIETDMTNKIPEPEKTNYIKTIPARRMGQTDEIANLVQFLLSDNAGYINGSEIKINGGLI